MKYYSIGEFADKIGKTIQTLRNWDGTVNSFAQISLDILAEV